jgi:hypothetical protein
VPPQQIHRTSVSKYGERHLDLDLPGARLEIRGDPADDGCVPFVQEPIELAASPSDDLDEIRIESREDTRDRAHGQVVDLSALEARDLALADPGSLRHIDLAPAEAMSQGSGDAAKAEVAHATIVRSDSHLRIHRRWPIRTV